MEMLGEFEKGVASGVRAAPLTPVQVRKPVSSHDGQQMKGRTISRRSVIYVDHPNHGSRFAEQAIKRKRADTDISEDDTIRQLTGSSTEGGAVYHLSAVENGFLNDAKTAWETACQHLDVVQDNLTKIAVSQRDFTLPVSLFQSMCDTNRVEKLWRLLELLRDRQETKTNLPSPARRIT